MDEFNWRCVGENKNFYFHSNESARADLILELLDGDLFIKKNRYGGEMGKVIMSPNEMAKFLLTNM